MPTIKRFEDLISWQKARDLVKFVFDLTKSSSFSKDFKLVDQKRSSSGSIMDNIAEGFERGGNKEFIQFLLIAKGSLGELKSQLYRASDNKYINENEFTLAYRSAEEIGGLIGGLINYLSQSDYQGKKYKDFIKE